MQIKFPISIKKEFFSRTLKIIQLKHTLLFYIFALIIILLSFTSQHDTAFIKIIYLCSIFILYAIKNGLKIEHYILYLILIFGFKNAIYAKNFLDLAISIFMINIPIYAIIGFRSQNDAPIKYFIISSISSIIFLLSISIFYMYENTIMIKNYTNPNSIIAVYLMLFSLFIKIGVFPGNIWVVDIYHGVYKKIIPIISFFPKLAILYVIFKLKSIFAATEYIDEFICIFSIITMIVGALCALFIYNTYRIIGYSAVLSIGFNILPLLSLPNFDYAFMFFMVYFFTILPIILGIAYYGDIIYNKNRIPKIFWIFVVFSLFGLTGIPPFPLFFAKIMIIKHLIHFGFIKIAFFSLILQSVAAFYYLKMISKIILNKKTALKYKINKPVILSVVSSILSFAIAFS